MIVFALIILWLYSELNLEHPVSNYNNFILNLLNTLKLYRGQNEVKFGDLSLVVSSLSQIWAKMIFEILHFIIIM